MDTVFYASNKMKWYVRSVGYVCSVQSLYSSHKRRLITDFPPCFGCELWLARVDEPNAAYMLCVSRGFW